MTQYTIDTGDNAHMSSITTAAKKPLARRLRTHAFATLTSMLCHPLMSVVAQEVVAPGQMLTPPSLETVDRNFVNVASGEVSITLQDVAIGNGQLSLSHTIGTHSSDFVNFESTWGPNEKFRGGLMKKQLRSRGYPGYSDDTFVANYFDFEGSIDFEILGNGTYTPLYDQNTSLNYSGGKYIVTKANGTIVEIPGAAGLFDDNSYSSATAGYTKITYPNGFEINVVRRSSAISARVDSVYTNNGLQLKYVYNTGYRHLPAGKDKNLIWPSSGIPKDGLEWSDRVPDSVIAINRGIEYCANTGVCNLAQPWPTATYHWPAGMPKAMYVEDTVFSVTDAAGRTTEYHHEAHDIEIGAPGGSHGNRFATRLKSIQFAGHSSESITYNYSNFFDTSPLTLQFFYYRKEIGPATLTGAVNQGVSTTYSVGAGGRQYNQDTNTREHTSTGGHKAVARYAMNTWFQVPIEAQLWDKNVTWYSPGKTYSDPTLSPIINRVHRIEHKRGKGATEYEYDGRGNLTKVRQESATSAHLLSEANYPTTCTNPKTCNQPDWVKDNRSSVTHYTYHAPSGMVSTVTLPADEQGQYARTRYGYHQKYAWYKNSAGTLTQAATPIWLLTSEKTCRVGNTRSDNTGCLTTGAEIITTYHYGTEDGSKANNLWVSGMTVTADGESRTTCYTYDRFGNRLSETAPKANLTSCP